MYKPITKWLLIVTALVWGIYDIFPFMSGERGDTISEVLATWALHSFSIPMCFGILCGHFFFLRDSGRPRPKILIPLVLCLITLDLLSYFDYIDVIGLQLYPYIWFILGLPVGTLLWPQKREDKWNIS